MPEFLQDTELSVDGLGVAEGAGLWVIGVPARAPHLGGQRCGGVEASGITLRPCLPCPRCSLHTLLLQLPRQGWALGRVG